MLFNGFEFLLLFQHDLSCLLADFATHTGTFRGNLYARLILLTIHESALTMRAVLAKDFREQLARTLGREELDHTVRQIHSRLDALFEESNATFGHVRHGIVAHRDRSAETRITLLNDAGQERIGQLVVEILPIVLSLSSLLKDYLESIRPDDGKSAA